MMQCLEDIIICPNWFKIYIYIYNNFPIWPLYKLIHYLMVFRRISDILVLVRCNTIRISNFLKYELNVMMHF